MEHEAERASILDDVAAIFQEVFAFDAWGRMLVSLARDGQGELRVADVDVEEVVDEGRVDAAFQSAAAHQAMTPIGKVVETLVLLEGLDPDAIGGGTFVRVLRDGTDGVEFMPGLVRAPSVAFDRVRDEVTAKTRARQARLFAELGLTAAPELRVDALRGTLEMARGGAVVATARHVVLGSFSEPHRSWVWGAHNPSLEPTARKASAEALDAFSERSAWEVATPGFVTDAATAWAVAAWVALDREMVAPLLVERDDGFIVLGLIEARPVEPA